MRIRMSSALPLAVAFALAGCHRHPAGTLWVDKAWVRLAAAPGRPSAGYLTIHGGAAAARLVAIETGVAGSSELHQSMKAGGSMMSMQHVDGIDVPADGTLALAPTGYHLMLFGLSPQIKPGGTLPLDVRFARGEPVRIDAKVIAAGDAAPY